MSSPLVADRPAAWEHGLSPRVLKRLRLLIGPFARPGSLAFDPTPYDRLYRASLIEWGNKLMRYALFQRLKRREGETEGDHRGRQAHWLGERRRWLAEWRDIFSEGHDIRTMLEPDGPFMPLGAWFAKPEQIVG